MRFNGNKNAVSALRSLVAAGVFFATFAAASIGLADPIQFGPEWTFTEKNGDIPYDRIIRKQDSLRELYEKLCAKPRANPCQVVESRGDLGFQVQYRDGWHFEVTTDPSVLEVRAKPVTLDQLKAGLERRIQADVFDVMATTGLYPHPVSGGGHISIGLKAFSSARALQNFHADWIGHWEISTGVWLDDAYNAAPYSSWPEVQQKRFQELHAKNYPTPEAYAAAINDNVYRDVPGKFHPREKYMDFNLTRARSETPAGERRVELRSIRAQRSAKEFRLQCELLEARIVMLRSVRTRLTVSDVQTSPYIQDSVDRFYTYVKEAGLGARWAEYQKLLPSDWLPLERRARLCVDALLPAAR